MTKSVKTDDNPFTKAEVHIANAKFYIQKHNIKNESEQLPSVVKIQYPESSSTKGKKMVISKSKDVAHKKTDLSLSNNESVIFQYLPKSRLEQGQSSRVSHEILKELTRHMANLML